MSNYFDTRPAAYSVQKDGQPYLAIGPAAAYERAAPSRPDVLFIRQIA